MNKKTPNDALKRLSNAEFKETEKTPIIIVLDNVRSAQNVGSVFRTSDAFLIEKIFLCGITPVPPSREMNKTALGATESVDWEYADSTLDCIKRLRQMEVECFAVEQTDDSGPLHQIKTPSGKVALIFGNEVDGVDQDVVDHCDQSLEIPQFGTKHSLNISVCAGMTIWEFYRRMKLSG